MYRLKQSQWNRLLNDIEKLSTGATIHKDRQTYAKTKDKMEYYCSCLNNKQGYNKELGFKYIKEILTQLRKYGYDDYIDFVEDFDNFGSGLGNNFVNT